MDAKKFFELVIPAGVVRSVSCNVSGGNLARKHAVNVRIDYSGLTVADILAWADDNRVIALQRPLRAFTDDELDAHVNGGLAIHARDCGAKTKTRAEKIAEMVRAGMPEVLATMAVDDPNGFAQLMATLGK